jgi:hypothetical protein
MTVTAMFSCEQVTDFKGGTSNVVLRPVYHGNDPTHPNRKFWDATPDGELEMTITVPESADFFEPGGVYKMTFERES